MLTSYRRMLPNSWKEHRTNQSILEEIGEETRLLKDIQRRKLQFFWHTRRERTTCAQRSFMAGSVVRNDEVVQEGDGQTTSETGWDHRSQNAQEWHRNENYEEQWCR